eukprot:TRINITY_DN535_c0_g2_i1.p1 TRINITY_DN535_c0_g2~~TRINITY_DN535_c0_g2_i1.p1  ORF type:complete len:288 (-),score=50.46 TRINITY_DN535_c0_g2_i1:233-1096(-)
MSSAVSIGFYRAPVTKVVTGSLCFLQFLSSLSRAPKSGGAHGFLVHLVFSDGLAALFGLSLVYKFREFERRFGSRKFAAFVMFVAALSFGLHLAIRNQNLDVFSHFPSILIFALFVQYFAEVPATSQSRLFGLPVTSKTFVYVQGYLYYRAMFFQDYTNLIAGLLCGFLYRMRSLPFRNMAVMKPIADFCSSNILPLVQTAPPRRRRNVVAPGQEFFPEFADTDAPSRTQAQANQTATRRHVQHQQDVDPAALSELVQMGFDSAQATQALRLTQNNIELATSLLLDS